MYQFGIDPRAAVATNMFGLTFMSVGGALPFIGKGTIDRKRLPALLALTLVGSVAGALLVLWVSSRVMPLFISVSMIAVAVFSFASRGVRAGRDEVGAAATPEGARGEAFDKDAARDKVGAAGRAGRSEGAPWEWAGLAATCALAVYGGFFSGGYVTILTAVFVGLFRMRFVEAVATTKIVNVCSSLVATLVFMWGGLVDYRLGLLLGAVMFAGAFAGARLALRLDEKILRRVFLSTVIVLALKMLCYDILWKGIQA
jgi:uncharacterized membrane protein YfcA